MAWNKRYRKQCGSIRKVGNRNLITEEMEIEYVDKINVTIINLQLSGSFFCCCWRFATNDFVLQESYALFMIYFIYELHCHFA